jgi:hypothetical protein
MIERLIMGTCMYTCFYMGIKKGKYGKYDKRTDLDRRITYGMKISDIETVDSTIILSLCCID